jgi:hypothetical protein
VSVDFQTESNLFEHRVGLIASSFFRLLSCFIFELAVVHDLCHWWLRVGGNFYQVKVSFGSESKCDLNRDNANLLTAWTNQADLRDADALIRAGIADAELLYSFFWLVLLGGTSRAEFARTALSRDAFGTLAAKPFSPE